MPVLISSISSSSGGGVAVLDDAGDAVVLADPHDAAVAGGVVEPGGEDRAGGVGAAVLGDQLGDRCRAAAAACRRGARARRRRRRVSSSGRPVRPTARASPVPRCTCCSTNSRRSPALSSVSFLVTRSAPWPTTTTARSISAGRQRVEHVEHHGAPAEQVQRLRPGRPHPRALARRQHHRRQVPTAHSEGLPRPAPDATRACATRLVRQPAERLGVDVAVDDLDEEAAVDAVGGRACRSRRPHRCRARRATVVGAVGRRGRTRRSGRRWWRPAG